MMKNVVSRNNLALKGVAHLTYLQGNCSDCKLIASKQKSVLLLFTLTWSPRLVYSSRMANLIERQRQKSDTQKFLSWRWYTIGLNIYEVTCHKLYDIRYYFTVFLEIVCPEKRASSSLDFSNPEFSTTNSSPQIPMGLKSSWWNSGVEKSRVEMSYYLLEFGHFNSIQFNHEFFDPIGVWG